MSLIVGYDISLPTPQTYAGLQTSVRNWLNRSDLTALIPDFITLCEERLNRALRVRRMEVALAAAAITDGTVAVPVGTAAVKDIWIQGYERSPLKPQNFAFIKSNSFGGVATHYAWQGDTFAFDGTGTVEGVLYQRIPVLSASNPSNWVLEDAPSAYLCGTLREAYDYLRNDSERDRWESRFQQVLAELVGNDQRDKFSGSLQVRVR